MLRWWQGWTLNSWWRSTQCGGGEEGSVQGSDGSLLNEGDSPWVAIAMGVENRQRKD